MLLSVSKLLTKKISCLNTRSSYLSLQKCFSACNLIFIWSESLFGIIVILYHDDISTFLHDFFENEKHD